MRNFGGGNRKYTCLYMYVCIHVYTHVSIYLFTCKYTCILHRIYMYVYTLIQTNKEIRWMKLHMRDKVCEEWNQNSRIWFDQYVGRGYSSTKATRETKFVVDVLKFLELGLGWYQILGSGPTSNEAGGNYSSKGFPAEKNAPSPAFKLNMRRRNHHHQPVADYYVRSTHTRPKRAQENLNVLERYRQLSQDKVKWFCFL